MHAHVQKPTIALSHSNFICAKGYPIFIKSNKKKNVMEKCIMNPNLLSSNLHYVMIKFWELKSHKNSRASLQLGVVLNHLHKLEYKNPCIIKSRIFISPRNTIKIFLCRSSIIIKYLYIKSFPYSEYKGVTFLSMITISKIVHHAPLSKNYEKENMLKHFDL